MLSYDRYRTVLKGDWKEANIPGAGQVYNLGSHIIDQVVALLGRPENVTGFIENLRGLGDPNVDDSVCKISAYSHPPLFPTHAHDAYKHSLRLSSGM